MIRAPSALAAPLLCLLLAPPVSAQQGAPADSGGETGQAPAELTVTYTGDALVVLGGADAGGNLLDDVDVQLFVDGDRALGWKGFSAFLYGLGNQGGSPSGRAGDLQGLDNVEAPTSWRIYEAWIQQVLAGERLSLLAGLYDVNSEFDALGSADLFVNSSFGIEPSFGLSGANGPSIFPVTSLAARLRALPAERWRVQAAVVDGVPGVPGEPGGTRVHLGGGDGALVVGEVAWLRPSLAEAQSHAPPSALRRRRVARGAEPPPHDAEVALGVWHYTGRALAGRTGSGAYLIGERRLRTREDGTRRAGEGGPEIWAFATLGVAQERASAATGFVGGGLSGTGLVPGRPDDRAGLGLAAARRSPALDAPGLPRWEVTLEATYRASLASWLTLQPDLQWIVDPALQPGGRDALTFGLRVEAGG